MPSFRHEVLVELFRDNAEPAAELLRSCAGLQVEHARVEGRSIDLSQVVPAEYRADAVTILHGRDGQPAAGVIVEVQRKVDDDKLMAWPAYVAILRAKFECAVVLLVVTPSRSVARWARQPIELGHPGFRLVPIVISFDDVPKVRDRVAASRLPELAVLSTMAHRELKIAEAAIEAISPLKEDQARLYLDVILDALPAAKRRRLEARMLRYEYKSDFARKYYGEGLEKGLQDGVEQGRLDGLKRGIKQGRREGREQGREQGRLEGHQAGLRGAVIALAQARLKRLPDEVVSAINAVSDPSILTELVSALCEARSVRGARAALESALAGSQRGPRRRR